MPALPLQPNTTTEAIAIIGIGCRFPGAESPQAFWQLLQQGVDAITKVPEERLRAGTFYHPNPTLASQLALHWGGFLEQVDGFDSQFFGIPRHEAECMDPQQRLLLEVAWESLENAGIVPDELAGSQTGVFVGISSNDYSRLLLHHQANIDAYAITGNTHSIAANRLSYLLDLQGPSLAVDTACSSSLVAVHLACSSLRNGECDLALAGGVNLILSPELSMGFARAGLMAADGRSKTFDAAADGFVRSEGCGVVVLKPLSKAMRDNDPILAVIRGSATNQDGHSNGLTAPNGVSQQRAIHQALRSAGVTPDQISYVETHGTGTSLGDPIEVNALKTVLMQDRLPEQLCALGSVKTNIGHLEAAAGIAGLIKTVLCLQHSEIPPHLHLKTLNPQISVEDTPFSIPTKRQHWLTGSDRRLAGVSSFGFGGTNAHVILEEAPRRELGELGRLFLELGENVFYLLPLSARSLEALRALAQAYWNFLKSDATAMLQDICYTASVHRTHHKHRLTLVGHSRQELVEQLEVFVQMQARPNLSSTHPLESLGSLYQQGDLVNWSQIYPDGGKCVQLPTYPWQRERCWLPVSVNPSAPPGLFSPPTKLHLESGDRQQLLESYFHKQLAMVLGISMSQVDEKRPLASLGIDSLMVIELKHRIETDLGVALRMAEILQCPSLEQLVAKVLAQLTVIDDLEEGEV